MFRVQYLMKRFSYLLTYSLRGRAQTISFHKVKVNPSSLWIPTTLFFITRSFYKKATFALEKQSDSIQMLIEKADTMYRTSVSYEELYTLLKNSKVITSAEVLWRLSRAARDYALKDPMITKERKKELIYEAYTYARESLIADDNNFASHKWLAITVGDVGEYEGTNSQISNAFVVREHLERALQLNPHDATTSFCMGMWCYLFADMPRWQRTIASYIFTSPPESTFQEAIKFFLNAEKVEPNFYSTNLLMLGKCYSKVGNTKLALLYLDKTMKYPSVTDEDFQNKQEAEKLLNEILRKK